MNTKIKLTSLLICNTIMLMNNDRDNLKTNNIKFSQNFLHSNSLVKNLIALSKISKQDNILEIGPGKGIITQNLSKASKSVTAIELDEKLAEELKTKFKGSNVKIVKGDFLDYKIQSYEYKVFSNIPFNITANIINKLLGSKNQPTQLFLIMQYEAFLKYAGLPYYKESFKSLLYKPFFHASVLYNFKATDFKPVPKAKIVFAKFNKKEPDILSNEFDTWKDFLAFMFLEKGVNIKEKTKKIFTYEQLKRILKDTAIAENLVITSLTYEQWLALFKIYNSSLVSAQKKNIVANSFSKMIKNEAKLTKINRNRNTANWRKNVGSYTKKQMLK